MSCVSSLSEYLLKVLTSVSGMKALLLDKETAPMTAIVLSQTDVINKEVFLTERIDMDGKGLSDGYPKLNHRGEIESQSPSKESFHHLRAVAIIRPCQASVDRLGQVMRSGKFKDYYIFFTNIADEELLKSLAQYDEFELIRQVTEIYGDYFALSDFVYHANLFSTKQLYALPGASHSPTFERNSEAIISLLLSFKVRPDIRYAGSSKLAKSIAVDVARRIEKENDLFTFQTQSPLLIVMDRVDDPVTPLLTQWTYQAMVHELMGIDNNRVSLANAPGVKKDLQEVVMSPHQDHFYKGSQYLNFGDLGTSVKELVTNFQRKTQNHAKLDSIEDMQRFVDNYPEFRSMSGTVSKHVAIMTELSRIVESRQLMRLSELEQELACNQDHTYAMDTLLVILDDPRIDFDDKLRLVCLYALRYENDRHQIPVFERLLRDRAQMDSDKLAKIRCVKALLAHAGSRQRGGDLFGNKDIWSKANKMLKSGLKGVDNIYTQHKPLLTETLALLAQNRLKTQDYPFTESRLNSGKNSNANKYRLIIIYMIGGITYEETLAVENFNNANSGLRVVIGGNCIHNSASFIQDILSGAMDVEM